MSGENETEETEETEEQQTEEQKGTEEETKEAKELIDQANKAADRMEGVNKDLAKLLKEKRELMQQEKLGGTSEAGSRSELTDDEKAIEGARKLLKGTGFDEQLFPQKKE